MFSMSKTKLNVQYQEDRIPMDGPLCIIKLKANHFND